MIVRSRLQPFLQTESAGGFAILLATFVALIWANFAPLTYERFQAITYFVNHALMTLFFFVMGFEIKREFISGELTSRKRAALPIIAAIGGMVVPALIYAAINFHSLHLHGWGIPMATDIAFAIGALSLVRGVPQNLRIFLLALAIADDIGAVLVMALFYSRPVDAVFVFATVLLAIASYIILRTRVHRWFFVPLAAAIWWSLDRSGIEPTLAGVILGGIAPVAKRSKNLQTESLVTLIHPWVTFAILPLFALCNAGIHIFHAGGTRALVPAVFWGIVLGLFIGKPLGIMTASGIASGIGIASPPQNLRWRQFCGVACLGGIGYTMALFVNNLAFSEPHLQLSAKYGIVCGSLLSAVLGLVLISG